MVSKKHVVVVGGGQMGRGIAQVSAMAGHSVDIVDVRAELAKAAVEKVGASLAKGAARGKWDALEAEAAIGRIAALSSLKEFQAKAERCLLIEAASENPDIKEVIFREADSCLPEDALLTSNTSSISVTRLAAQTQRPDKVLGVHFMNPVPVMKLVEVVRAIQTSDESYRDAMAFVESLGKESVTARDSPAFIVNRLLMPLLNEACFALQEGLGSIEDIDKSVRLGLNHPMGPFELADFVGLDTVLAIAEVLQRDFGDAKYRPSVLLRQYVDAGWYGRKAKRGFYRYDESGKKLSQDA